MTDATQRLIDAVQAALEWIEDADLSAGCAAADDLRTALAAARQEAEQRPKPVTWLTEHRGNYWPCPPDVPGAFPVYASTPTPAPAAPEHPPTAPSAPAKEQ